MRLWPAALAWALLVPALAAAASQTAALPATPPIVDAVRAEREGQAVDDPTIVALIEPAVGKPLSMSAVRETITHLVTLEMFEDVQVLQAASNSGGIVLTYVLVPTHPVDRLEFRGMLGLPLSDVRKLVRDQFGETPQSARVPSIPAALKTSYRDRGYPNAAITASVEERHAPDRATLVLDIQAGSRPPIVDTRLTQTDADERGLVDEPPVVRTGTPYDKATVDRELERWTDHMHGRGFYEARASHGVLFPPDGAALSITVTWGPKIAVEFAGDSLPASDRDRLVPIRSEASADEDLLEDSARAIEAFLRGRGYRDARATYSRAPKKTEVVITFDVRRGPRYVLGDVHVEGASAIAPPEVRNLLAIKEGEPFTAAARDAGVTAVRNAYLARGFTRATVEPSEVVVVPPNLDDPSRKVNVTVTIAEGPRTTVRTITVLGPSALSIATVRGFVQLAAARPLAEREVAADRDRIELEYRNRGYEQVSVRSEVVRVENDAQADLRYIVSEGPQILVDRVVIAGNTRTNAETIEHELQVRPGQPLGYSALLESRSRLVALGLFRRVTIDDVPHAGEPKHDLVVHVEESPPTVIGGGGGVEGAFRVRTDDNGQAVERFELAPRGFFQIGRRNLWGKNRSVNLFTRVGLRSRDVSATSNGLQVTNPSKEGGYGFNEYRVVGTFREPRAFGTRSDVLFTGILEQAIRSSFNFLRREARVESGLRLSRVYTLTGRYSLQRTELFDEQIAPSDQSLIDRVFPQFRLSTFSGAILRDSRDDILDTAKGSLVVVDTDVAARAVGSEVGFAKTYVQGRTFYRLPTARRTVLAFAARLGVAHGFPRAVPRVDANGAPVVGVDGAPIVDVVQDLPASERFFAGGDTTVRGFALDRLGGVSTISDTGFPRGGNGVVVLNSEVRVAAFGPLQAVGFMDAGNVVAYVRDLDLFNLRASPGFGVRYKSPVGPIRLDFGFKLDRRELSPGNPERRIIWHISLGQAF